MDHIGRGYLTPRWSQTPDGSYVADPEAGTFTSEWASDEGVAQAHKAIFDAGGTETWTIVETLTPTSEEEFAIEMDLM